MFFLPRRNASHTYLDTGIVSEKLLSEAIFELTINLNMAATDFKGITINFGENYPVNFDMVSSSGQVIEYRNNTESLFTTEEVLENTTQVKLVVYSMKNPQSRLRIYSIRFGYGLVYYNNDVMSSSLESYVSPIGADVPQIDFTVQLKNYDHYFNVDNPKSAINFLETGQEMQIHYGYQLPDSDEIEWIIGNNLLCSEWESDDYTATIRCQDIFRNMDSEFYKGIYNRNGISYYDLAVAVLRDAGFTDYYIDPQLKNLYTKNPLPRVQHKEALQIIANACRCVLSQTRLGKIQIKSSFVPEAQASAETEAEYSNVENIMNTEVKDEYASLATNYAVADGSMFFLPRNGVGVRNTGYVSAEISNEQCEFEKNPKVTIRQEVACMYYGARFTFGQSLPSAFIIRTYNNGELVNTVEVGENEISKVTVVHTELDDFDTMVVEFTKTAEPQNRIVLNNFSFGDVTEFTMTRNDMTSSPKAIKQELVKEVIVPAYSYQNGVQEESLISEEVTVAVGDITTFFVGEPSYNYRAVVDEDASGVTILEWGNYYIKVQFNVAGTYRLEIFGYRYKIVEQYAVKSLNNRGRTIKWENPLMSDIAMATDLAEWLGDYYASGIEYEYNTRGNPELDVNDIVYQENEFHDGMKVTIYRQTLNFNQSFSGKVTARRLGG
ncbi:hypothetical protein [Lacrimispora defluvii]|uniref:Tail protein n=1 Tax=Lacrimispora defluvii TaxID=2719233 RepID=A0ABX1VW03_9FIRM|nr:hypothetical protein [Lacrimispora defluvii]NNJ30556.1 hypothetical protein [Lacrimispora defluvii]